MFTEAPGQRLAQRWQFLAQSAARQLAKDELRVCEPPSVSASLNRNSKWKFRLKGFDLLKRPCFDRIYNAFHLIFQFIPSSIDDLALKFLRIDVNDVVLF